MPGLVAAAPYERRMEVLRQKRQAHAAAIEAARRRGEGGARLASAATGDVAAPARGHAGSDDDDLGGSGGGSSGDEGQRGAAGSDSDAEEEQRRQGGGAGGGRKRKRQFVLEAQPDKGCACAQGGLQLLPACALPLLLASARACELPSVWPAKESRLDQCSSTSPVPASHLPRCAASTARPASSCPTPPRRTTPARSFTRWATPGSRTRCWTSPPRTRVGARAIQGPAGCVFMSGWALGDAGCKDAVLRPQGGGRGWVGVCRVGRRSGKGAQRPAGEPRGDRVRASRDVLLLPRLPCPAQSACARSRARSATGTSAVPRGTCAPLTDPCCTASPSGTADGMRAQSRAQYHWDKRSKKYVKLQAGEAVKAGKRVRTESGAKVRWGGGRSAMMSAGCCRNRAGRVEAGAARQDGVGRQGAGRSPRALLGCRVAGCVCRVAGSACKAMCVPSMRAKSNRVPWCTRIVDDEPACLPSRHPQGKATTGLYEKWSKKTRLRVAPGGADEAGERLAAQMGDR